MAAFSAPSCVPLFALSFALRSAFSARFVFARLIRRIGSSLPVESRAPRPAAVLLDGRQARHSPI